MSGNFLYFNYIKPGTRYYELPDKVDDHTDYILDLPSEDWEIVEFTNWRFYSNSAIRMQDQGWKIHISATTETAEEVLKRVGEILFKKNIAFKHIANEEFLKLMNSKHGNRASAGKFMAIYPDDNIFPILLDELHECLKGVEKGPYDKLMTTIGRTIKDGDVISIIRKYLVSGIMIDDEYEDSIVGTPQGGNLSPLLANIMLNELDKEMEKRGLNFVRYADDCIIMVGSEMSANRVMRNISRFIEEKLGLKVNMTKSKVDRPRGLKWILL